MSTKTEMELKQMKNDREIADHDRASRERTAKISAVTNIAGSILGALARIGASKIGVATKDAIKRKPGSTGGIWYHKYGDNDSAWYKRLAGLVEPNTMLPDFTVLGQLDGLIRQGFTGVPLVYRFNYAPTIGQSLYTVENGQTRSQTHGTDPFNRALNRVATQLENRNSRVLSYSRDTIGRYIFIVTDVAQDIIRLKLALEWFDVAQSDKPFLARQIIRALGFNYNDFRNNVASYKAAYVSLAADFNNGLPIPSDLSYLNRKDYLSRVVVADTNGEYSSLMIFNKAVDFTFVEGDDHISVDNYISQKQPSTGYVFQNYVTSLRIRISLLVNGSTWKPLIRDLRGSTKSDAWFKLPEDVNTMYTIVTSSEEIRNQLHNMDMQPCFPPSTYPDVDGMVIPSFSIGGDADEAVRQGFVYGISSLDNGQGSDLNSAYICGAAGVILIKFDSSSEADTFVAKWEDMYGALGQINAAFTATQIYNQYDKYTSDSIIVGTRLKSIWACKKLTIGTTHLKFAAGVDSGEGTTNTFSVAANTNANIVAVFPLTVGTELMLNVSVIKDQPDNVTFPLGSSLYVTKLGYSYISSGRDVLVTEMSNYQNGITPSNGSDPAFSLVHNSLLTILDWTPIVHIYYPSYETLLDVQNEGWTIVSELDHYIPLDGQVLVRLHHQAIESEAYLPESVYLKPLQ